MIRLRELLLLLLVASASQNSLATVTSDIQALVQQGHHEAAYGLGSQHPELLGEPTFDYFFGISAIDTGHTGEGVLALERSITLAPGNLAARAELARAYWISGEDQRAREEFDAVLKQNPDEAVRRTIERYLDAIAARESRRRPAATFYLEGGFGSDSNTNGGVSDAAIHLPIYGDVLVSPGGIRKSDTFTALAAGGLLTRPLTPEWTLFGNFGIDAKLNSRYNETDLMTTSLGGGIAHQAGETSYRLSANQDVVSVGNDRFRTANAVGGQWQRQIGHTQAVQASLHWASYAYAGANEARDADFSAIGLGYRKSIGGEWQPVLFLAANFGEEHNNRNRPDLGRDIGGARIAFSAVPAPDWTVTVGASYQDSRYLALDTLLATRRHDDYTAIDVTIGYAFDRQLSVRGELLFSENQSNLALYHYRRDVAAVKLRYEFR